MSDNARIIISIDEQGGGSAGSARTGSAPSQTGSTSNANPLSLGTGSLGAIPLMGLGINAPNYMGGAHNIPATTGSPLAFAQAGVQPQMARPNVMGPAPHPLMAGMNTGLIAAATGQGLNIGRGLINIAGGGVTSGIPNLNPLGVNMPMGLGAGGVTTGGIGAGLAMAPHLLAAMAGTIQAMRNRVAGIAGAGAGWAASMIPGVGPWGGIATGAATAFGLNRLGASFLPAAAGVTAVSVVAISGQAVRSMANSLTASLRDRAMYSGPMTEATVVSELRQLAFNIRDAQRNGVQYGNFINKTSLLDIAFQDMMSPMKRLIMSILEPFMDLFTGVFKFLGGIFELLQPLGELIKIGLFPLTVIGDLMGKVGEGITELVNAAKGKVADSLHPATKDILDILEKQKLDVPVLQRQGINQRLRIPAFAGIN